ncbi:hypothetical protein JJD41_18035 [Oxynema sp. CENA135]|jgi:hypothetical protein|uniref:DUF4351 domain-containing protein n=1 Tax=Oxynema aestuarii AP17 TaxID=2064643 RepID=A0A6H1TX46_9CYAN|nr:MULTISPECIES: hypothetical protein [Oxynema]MBK4731751.1 hypothetical protein [Oxynema sp. CENA135]QIZ70717.1 hypothetical protein HCG48_09095 [Oxynema aestuarii AP17]RMH75378.1 MAG: hypothetical protein D6680_11875 [Cyanobacteria bacterium J007]
MNNLSEQDVFVVEVSRERSIRRTVMLLETKRRRMREEAIELIRNLAFLSLPVDLARNTPDLSEDILAEALSRLGDDAFARWLWETIQEPTP